MDDRVRLGRSQRGWSMLAFIAVVAGMVAWWDTKASADSPLGTTGATGIHWLFDEPGQPGASCVLEPETRTVTFTVSAPYVVGLDRDPEFVEATAVSWNVILLQDGTPIDESDRRYGSAGEVSSATFEPIVLDSPVLAGLLAIQVEIQWLDFPEMANETVLGSSLRGVDYYGQNRNDGAGPRSVEGGCRLAGAPTPVPTDTPQPTLTPIPPTATPTITPTATATTEPTATSTPDPPATNTPPPTATSTPAPTATDTPEPAATATATATPSPPPTPSPTETAPPTPTAATAAPAATRTPVPTLAPTPSPAATYTPAPAATPTATPVPSTPPNGPATLTASSSRGTVNSNLRFSLSGFPANAYVEITFSGATVAALTTTPDGTGAVTIKVPAKPAGTYPLWAVSPSESASASYTIAPRIKVIPGGAGPGDQVEISLRGFGRNEAVRVRWLVDGRWIEVGVVPRTSNTGSANILVTVPAGAVSGPAKVRGDGSIARAQTNAFVVE